MLTFNAEKYDLYYGWQQKPSLPPIGPLIYRFVFSVPLAMSEVILHTFLKLHHRPSVCSISAAYDTNDRSPLGINWEENAWNTRAIVKLLKHPRVYVDGRP